MCGISGFIDFKGQSDENTLRKMQDTLHHRGPDGQGVFFQKTDGYSIGLGHSRLSIIDLSTSANQPLYYKDWVIVFNGELYNYAEIKLELEQLGHEFSTHSDTEVILHAWEVWGKNAVHRFVGMFVFIIYDRLKKNLVLFRDRAGVKPLFCYWQENLFLFSSELKAFHKHSGFRRELNQSALAQYLKYGYVPTPHCIFNNCFKLEPGHFMEVHLSESTYEIHQYWNVNTFYAMPKLKIDEREAIDETEKILKKAFDYRLVADVPVGVFLSGGYDSSAVVALLQKDRTEKIKTFSIGFEEESYNESPYAAKVAHILGTDHSEHTCTIRETKDILPTLPFYYDEPFGDESAIPTILVSHMARKSVTVSLSADGGDEVFGGYNRYPIIQKLDRTFGRLPHFSRNLAHIASGWIQPERIPLLKKRRLIGQRYEKFRKLILESNASHYLKSMCAVIDDSTLNILLTNRFEEIETRFDEDDSSILHLLDRVLAKDYKTYMVDDILTKVDRATMSVSLEGREPFLDHNIIEWVARLPVEYKINKGNKKYILKQITHKYLPEAIMNRPKMGFGIPIENWFKEDLSEYFKIYFSREFLSRQGLFNYDLIHRWVQMYLSGRKDYIKQLWVILMFQLWYKKWMLNEDI